MDPFDDEMGAEELYRLNQLNEQYLAFDDDEGNSSHTRTNRIFTKERKKKSNQSKPSTDLERARKTEATAGQGLGHTIIIGPGSNQIDNKHNGLGLSLESHWSRPGYNKTDADRSQATLASQQRISQRLRKIIRSHDNRGPLPDKGPTPTTTILGEILGNPSTRLAYKRNPLTLQMLLPIIAEKVHKEKARQDKLKEVKARLNFEGCSGKNSKIQEVSQHSESKTPDVRGDLRRRLRSRRSRSMSRSPEPTPSVFSRIRRDRSESPRNRLGDKGRKEGGVFKRLEGTGRRRLYGERNQSQRVRIAEEDTGSQDQKKQKSSIEEDDLSQPWVCEENDPFTSRIRYFDFPKKTRMLSNVKTYDGSEYPGDHLKIFQAAAKVERWAMPTWCHMFNSTLTGSSRVWFDDLASKSVDSYDDLKKAYLANFFQQKKCIKDPMEIPHIKQREGESIEDFVQRFKTESRHVKGAPECMRISGFMHRITNPELIKRLHDNIPKLVDEMMRVTTAFHRGEVAASNQARKKTLPAWKQQEAGRKQNFDRRRDFRNQQRSERRRDKFTLLTKSPRGILALDKGKFKTPPPMMTPIEKRNNNKFCEFHGEVGHNTNECMHLKRQIEELIKAGKLSHVIKELNKAAERTSRKQQRKEKLPERTKLWRF
ncbi:reverse transcriptase domain-containing protein [Tanacetum coccineum]